MVENRITCTLKSRRGFSFGGFFLPPDESGGYAQVSPKGFRKQIHSLKAFFDSPFFKQIKSENGEDFQNIHIYTLNLKGCVKKDSSTGNFRWLTTVVNSLIFKNFPYTTNSHRTD